MAEKAPFPLEGRVSAPRLDAAFILLAPFSSVTRFAHAQGIVGGKKEASR